MSAPQGIADDLVPVRRSDLLTADVDTGLLVVDPRLIRAHGLNAPAAAVLDLCDGAHDVTTIAAAAADRAGTTVDAVAGDVRTILGSLAEEYLVLPDADTPPPRARPPQNFANVPHTGEMMPRAATASFPTTRTFEALDFRFRYRCEDPEFAAWLDAVLRPLAVGGASDQGRSGTGVAPPHEYVVQTTTDDGRLLLGLDDHVVRRFSDAAELAASCTWHANQMASTSSRRHVQLHASAAVIDGVAVVASAAMNAGKSTLVAGLVAAGAGYLTDETVALAPPGSDGRPVALPYPKPIALDPGSWDVLPALEPPSRPGDDRFGHAKWYVDPEAVRPGSIADAAPIGLVVLPRYDPDAATSATPVDPLRAAVILASNCFNLVGLGQAGVDRLADLARHAPAFELVVSDLDTAIETVMSLASAPDGATTSSGRASLDAL